MKLYELTDNYLRLQELLEENETEAVMDTLDAITDGFHDKAENIAKIIKSLAADAEMAGTEAKRLLKRKQALENNVQKLKTYLQTEMERMEIRKINSTLFTIQIQKNPVSVEIVDDSLLQAFFLLQEPKIDKKRIAEILKSGEEVKGARLVESESIRIR
ncbi:siphovirus Gp157 family protein [Listeria monocytogenes]|uniref:siphovirus Gp157 family protein n=1 Tax=Listeria monocytogenes TaxID=1639 RepID=UPI000868C782|nr:siphovirus Gp157 family protein [Listeria monocytogenes]EAC4316597.1 siphovirus Gp157 family protein [Listeria monocytogenes]EAD0587030.1 siphovirus Gp157 family protein [Listeria monocytogenes]EAD0590230.1 siphovirus Gp157 family protein [Listeria monocytogenes]EAD2562980.1 siphovirus Gp157 family protein [Listeria monocytogenes]EAD3232573.1 siphovirus Gp157 family protein [Listeria monocytogenes]